MEKLSVPLTKSSVRMSSPMRIAPMFASSILALTAFASGCGKSPYDLAPVHGKVTLNGEPLTNAKVMFAPIAKSESRKSGKPAFGVLQPDGTFVLGTDK